MNITVTDQPQCKKRIRIEIPGDKVREETDKIATNLARQISVPGFRRGHVPKSVVKTRFRKELRDEVLSHLLPHSLSDAIEEKNLKVIGEPSIDNLQFGEDESIDVTFSLDVAPEFELANYKGLPITKRVYKVTDEDVDKVINRLRESRAELVPVEDRGAQAGDIVTANLTGKFEPKAKADESTEQAAEAEAAQSSDAEQSEQVEEAKSEEAPQPEEINQQDVEIQLGAAGMLKEFTEALTGARVGDSREFAVRYADDYKPERFAGRTVHYTAEVTAIRVKELPEPDDEFAQGLEEETKTMDELRARVRSNLEHEAEHRTENELRSAVIEQLVERNRFELPESIVEKQMDSRFNTFVRGLFNQGIDPRQLKLDWEGLRESQRERAERDVRASFITERIAEVENIEVTEEDVNKELEHFAEHSGEDVAALRARLTKEGGLDSIKEQIKHRKTIDLVIASADIKIEEVQGLGDENDEEDSGEDEQVVE